MQPEAQVPGPDHVLTARELVSELLRMLQKGDFSRAREIFAEDIIAEWPQSRERIRGVENLVAIFSNYPGGLIQSVQSPVHFAGTDRSYLMTPLFTVVKAQGTGDSASGSILTRYPDGSDWYVIMFVTAKNGRIVFNETYFAPVFDAPEWRSKWVEPMEE